jgi:Domain of unknown function (DUF4258)
MFEKIRNKIREKIRSLEYVMTIHAEDEMENDGLSIFDIENGILTGEIIERQKTAKQMNGNIWLREKLSMMRASQLR